MGWPAGLEAGDVKPGVHRSVLSVPKGLRCEKSLLVGGEALVVVGRETGSMVRGVRADAAEWARWRAAAGAQGMPLNAWIRAALGDQAELDEALGREARNDAVLGSP